MGGGAEPKMGWSCFFQVKYRGLGVLEDDSFEGRRASSSQAFYKLLLTASGDQEPGPKARKSP